MKTLFVILFCLFIQTGHCGETEEPPVYYYDKNGNFTMHFKYDAKFKTAPEDRWYEPQRQYYLYCVPHCPIVEYSTINVNIGKYDRYRRRRHLYTNKRYNHKHVFSK